MAFAVQIAKGIKGIFDLVRDDLTLVEQEIAAQSRGAIEPVAEISSYLREGGGKRLRPALLLLSAGAAGYRGESAIRLGAVVEMIHSATLVHDDVIDGAETRRGRPSTNARWGNHMSVLAGDWLYMQSFEMALRERNFAVLDILIDLTQNMVEGELLQLACLGRIDVTEAEAIDLSYRKTACLFSGCARLGAVLGKQPKHIEEALAEYGRNAGLAFQLVDDLLDFTASLEKLGKPVLSDLKEGKVTLPLIFALQGGALQGAADGNGNGHPSSEGRKLIARVLEERGFLSVHPDQIAKLVRETGALDRAGKLARDYANRAKACLDELPDTEYRRALRAVPDFILEREN
ncbi:MAG TPA: polyprenyl synthetase family protein [Candidatus Acidoferrales bacterium]|jgi:octaprenyl-diphosphate synthase|nr:polyprenyl synthetase family protein [Candidatus Acidoferrales bacterium]